MKKIISILLIALIAVSFFACKKSDSKGGEKETAASADVVTSGKEEKSEDKSISESTSASSSNEKVSIIGRWKGQMSFSELISSNENGFDKETSELLNIDSIKEPMIFDLEYKQDGTYKFIVDGDSLVKISNRLTENFKAGVCKNMRKSDSSYAKMSDEQVLAAYEKISGKSIEDSVDELFHFNRMKESLSKSGTYKYNDGALYLDGSKEPAEITFDGNNKMTMSANGSDMKFVRQ